MPQRKGVKSAARATITNSEQEGLPNNDPIDIVRIPSWNIQIVERSKENPTKESRDLVALKDYFDTKFNVLEAK